MEIKDIYSIYKQFPTVVTDSRAITKDSIFFALKGDNFNGNLYAIDALSKGARYAVIDEDIQDNSSGLIRVNNVLECLQKLANFHRKTLDIPVIGITGTNGKTTSKELIHSVLSQKFNVLATKGNFNNHIGVPLTLLKINKEHEIAIVEMGANHSGEIAELCEISEPNYGLVTNVGMAHLEGFGSFENIISTKSDLYKYVKSRGGINFTLKENTEILSYLGNGFDFVEYSCQGEEIENYGYGDVTDLFLNFKLQQVSSNTFSPTSIQTKMVGLYNQTNIMAAITIGNYFKVPLVDIKTALESYSPDNNRSQLEKTGRNTLVLDAYNANPTSVINALENVSSMDHSNKLIILGDMFELGQYSEQKHQEIVDLIVRDYSIRVILVGKDFFETDTKDSELISKYINTNDLIASGKLEKLANMLILLKGSRGMSLEGLVSYL